MEEPAGAVSEYRTTFKLVNVANYGVPQKRMRVFFAGFRADQDTPWEPSTGTHISDALLLSQWASNEYCETTRRSRATNRHDPRA